MRQALGDYDHQLRQTTQNLAEFKSRALRAEAELSELTSSSQRLSDLEHELKEKNALIGKLRHESPSLLLPFVFFFSDYQLHTVQPSSPMNISPKPCADCANQPRPKTSIVV